MTYDYDAPGDLVEFLDQDGNKTTFVHDARHNLLEIHDPLGNRAVRTEYDGDGRVVAVIDARGKRTTIAHDTLTYGYDANGDLTVHRRKKRSLNECRAFSEARRRTRRARAARTPESQRVALRCGESLRMIQMLPVVSVSVA
jgi:YD repeat-containing protein